MDSRKIQRSVSGSYIITLPKEWVEKHGLEKGERVSLVLNEDGILNLVPATRPSNSVQECYQNFDEYETPSLVERRVKACYVEGDDVIIVNSKNFIPPEAKARIKMAAGELIGMELSEDFANKMVLRTLVDPARFPVRDLMKRIYVLASSMHQDSMEALRRREESLARDVVQREREVEKLYRLLLRQLMISAKRIEVARALGIRDFRSSLVAALVGRDLNRVAFYGASIARDMKAAGEADGVVSDLQEMSERAKSLLESAMAAYFTEDFNLASRVIDGLEGVREMDTKTEEKILRKVKDPSSVLALTRIGRSLRRIAYGAANIAESTLVRVNGIEG